MRRRGTALPQHSTRFVLDARVFVSAAHCSRAGAGHSMTVHLLTPLQSRGFLQTAASPRASSWSIPSVKRLHQTREPDCTSAAREGGVGSGWRSWREPAYAPGSAVWTGWCLRWASACGKLSPVTMRQALPRAGTAAQSELAPPTPQPACQPWPLSVSALTAGTGHSSRISPCAVCLGPGWRSSRESPAWSCCCQTAVAGLHL